MLARRGAHKSDADLVGMEWKQPAVDSWRERLQRFKRHIVQINLARLAVLGFG